MRNITEERKAFPYEEILRLGMPERDQYFYLKHPKMPCGKRAKIFAPFSALKGFDEEVASKEVRYVEKRGLSDEEVQTINTCLSEIYAAAKTERLAEKAGIRVRLCCYRPCEDDHHPDYRIRGTYETMTGLVKRIDPIRHVLCLEQDTIPFDCLAEIEILGSNRTFLPEKSYFPEENEEF